MSRKNAARDARILTLIGDGLTYDHVAARLGITRSTVSGVANRARAAGMIGSRRPELGGVSIPVAVAPDVAQQLRAIAAEGRWSSLGALCASMLAEIARDDAAAHGGRA